MIRGAIFILVRVITYTSFYSKRSVKNFFPYQKRLVDNDVFVYNGTVVLLLQAAELHLAEVSHVAPLKFIKTNLKKIKSSRQICKKSSSSRQTCKISSSSRQTCKKSSSSRKTCKKSSSSRQTFKKSSSSRQISKISSSSIQTCKKSTGK